MMPRTVLCVLATTFFILSASHRLEAQPVPGEKMSHSVDSVTVELGGSVFCTPEQPWPAEGWLRSYDPRDFRITGEFDIVSIDFAVVCDAGSGATEQPVDVIIWEDDDPAYPVLADDLTELYRAEVMVGDDSNLDILRHALDPPLRVTADTALAIEIRHPNFESTGLVDRQFLVDANDDGQTAPSYFVGGDGDCEDIVDPFDLAALEPDAFIHLVIDVNYEGGCVPPSEFTCEEDTSGVALAWTNNGDYENVDVWRGDEVIATLSGDETSYVDEDAAAGYNRYRLEVSQDGFCSTLSGSCTLGALEECSSPDVFISFLLDPVVDVVTFDSVTEVQDLDVFVDIEHTWLGDVSIVLESPTGTEVTLKEDSTGDDFDNILVTFDDEGLAYLPRTLPLGEHQAPQGPGVLSDFDDEFTAGDWTLTVADAVDFDDGTLNSWCVRIEPTITDLFKRGDVDGNGSVFALVDALFLLQYQFNGGLIPGCFDAADVDGNNIVSALLDSLMLLTWQFASGPDPVSPGPDECGPDPDLDGAVDCVEPPPACN